MTLPSSDGTKAASKISSLACDRCRAGKRKCDKLLPKCSTCDRLSKDCIYSGDGRSRKRKYWDEEYVIALEDQVQALLERLDTAENRPTYPYLLSASVDAQQSHSAFPDADLPDLPTIESESSKAFDAVQMRSQQAVDELSVMMWRTNLGDGVTILDGIEIDPVKDSMRVPTDTSYRTAPTKLDELVQSKDLIHRLGDLFLKYINADHQFTSYTSTDFLDDYPHQKTDLLFLHSAILAAGAPFSDIPEDRMAGQHFADYAETLVFTCSRNKPSTSVVRAFCILSWRSLALGIDQFGWIFISMAAGTAVHLRLHVLALDEVNAKSHTPSLEEIRAFWMFYMTDHSAVSILGRNCALPWRRVNVPSFDTAFTNDENDLDRIAFAWQCKLWYLHDQYMDQIYGSTFAALSSAERTKLLVSTHRALSEFYKTIDKRLLFTSINRSSKAIILFHMAYQMAFLLAMPQFLTLTTATNEQDSNVADPILMILYSLTRAAKSMTRLSRLYVKHHDPRTANPIVIHHLLIAATVHLMNATSNSASLSQQGVRLFKESMETLSLLRKTWSVRADKSIKVLRALAARWHVLHVLPVEIDHSLEAGFIAPEIANDSTFDMAQNILEVPNAELEASSTELFNNLAALSDSNAFDTFDPSNIVLNEYMETGIDVPNFNLFTAFQSLNDDSDLGWIFSHGTATDFV